MSKFAKRHYEAIALAFQDAAREAAYKEGDDSSLAIGVRLARAFIADALASDNGQFKRDRFILACEPGNNVRARS